MTHDCSTQPRPLKWRCGPRIPSRLLALLCLLAGLGAIVWTEAASAQTVARYTVRLDGDLPDDLRAKLMQTSLLISQTGDPPASLGGLRRRIDADVPRLGDVLRSLGYYDGRITPLLDQSAPTTAVTLRVAPGPLYLLGTVTIVYDGPAPVDDVIPVIQAAVGLAPGAPAVAQDILNAELRGITSLPDLGYPLAQSGKPRFIVDHATRTVDATFHYNAGPLLYFGSLSFDGLESIDAAYLARLKPWADGDRFSQGLFDDYRRTLNRTGLFRRLDARLPVRTDLTDGEAPAIVIIADEAPHRTISLSASFSTTEGFGGETIWEHRNLFGRNERLTVTGRGAQIEQSATADLRKPHFRRLDQTFTARVRAGRRDTDAFTENAFLVGAGLERQLSRKWSAALGAEVEFENVTDAEGEENFLVVAIPVGVNWDNTDSLLDPRSGARLNIRAIPATAISGDVFGFLTTQISLRGYYPVDAARRIVLAGRGRIGTITGVETLTLPAGRRFFAGGGGSIRGFGFQDVGPLDEEDDPAGGRSVVEVGGEIRWQAFGNIGLVPFIEGGNVYDETLPDFSGFRWGAGLGFRYYTSFGPIRFDVATPLDPVEKDDVVQFYISIGQSF